MTPSTDVPARKSKWVITLECGTRQSISSFRLGLERAIDLASYCTDMVRKGQDFPTIWQGRLKRHPLIDGIPRQIREGNQNLLEIRLITGESLVFDADAKTFTVR